ncbi:MAG TPA: hypothetical protein DCR72_00510, partial [Pseudomonas sp.]|nr:hypothetical protein [Pseudomonas sp.]
MATDLDPEKQAQFGLRRAQQQPAQPQPQLGMTLAPDQQRRQRIDADMQRASERIRETKRGLTKAASTVGDAIGSAYGTVLKAGTAVPRGLYGIATGETPVTFSSELPDYTNRGLDRRRAGNFVKDNPEQAEAARLGLRSVADRASSSAIGAVKAAQPAPAAAG